MVNRELTGARHRFPFRDGAEGAGCPFAGARCRLAGMTEHIAYEGPERRGAERHASAIAIGIREMGRHHMPATLTSLSADGGSVVGVTLNGGAQLVWIRIPGLESLPARLCWNTPGGAGFAFDNPLHPAVAARVLGADAAGQGPIDGPVPERIANRPASRRDQILGGVAELPRTVLRGKAPREGAGTLDGMIRRDTARAVEQRTEARYPPPEQAADGFELEGQPVSLRDLSESGLQVDSQLKGKIGRKVKVQFDGFPAMSGRIAWANRGATGVRLPKGSLELFEVD